jgi:hypothetical protein
MVMFISRLQHLRRADTRALDPETQIDVRTIRHGSHLMLGPGSGNL